MHIVHLAAGAGGMYCGACARDAELIRGLIARGHDATVIPLYTPLRNDGGPALATEPIFLGGINAYLQQVAPVFRHTPRWLDRWLDSPALLRWASRFAVSVKPQDLGPMTVSVLQGLDGLQRKELRRLLEFVESGPRPGLVSLTNSLLSGAAPGIKRRLGVPIVSLLQGEDSFVEAMPEPYRREARDLLRRNAAAIDLFISPGEAYADRMAGFLSVPRSRIAVIRASIDLSVYGAVERQPAGLPTIAYLSVINKPKGLDLLADAWVQVARNHGIDARLVVAGKVMDDGLWRQVVAAVEGAGLGNRFEALGEVDRAGKLDMLARATVFCVPSRFAESRGVAVMEAQAAGVPVVVPDSGIYPEMLRLTGGGVLFPPGDAGALADALAGTLRDPGAARSMGRAGAEGIARHFGADRMVDSTLAEYTRLLGVKAT